MSRMGAPGTWDAGNTPWPWDPKRAITFFDAINLIDVYLDQAVPISREMVALFFFHETAFSDIRQKVDKKKPTDSGLGPGVGFGQLEIQNSDKPLFFNKVYGIKPDNSLFDKITADESYAIKVHCAYLKHLYDNGATTTGALVSGQVGGKTQNASLAQRFMHAEPRLKSAIYSTSQDAIIEALNTCRWYLDPGDEMKVKILHTQVTPDNKGQWFNPITLPKFQQYWNFTVPKSELLYGIRK
jgi:hypothetical protein